MAIRTLKDTEIFSMNRIYEPIVRKIDSWLDYYNTMPKGKYEEHKEEFEEYRKSHDLDCILTEGNLYADTIFSLWTPLKNVLYHRNTYVGDVFEVLEIEVLRKSPELLKRIKTHIEEVLPDNEETVKLLAELFELGQERCNVMILPERVMNSKRGGKPYYDYVPHFLYECFEGGDFAKYYEGDDDFRNWIAREALQDFFVNEMIVKENVKDLADTGDLSKYIPSDVVRYLENYIEILKSRKERITSQYTK